MEGFYQKVGLVLFWIILCGCSTHYESVFFKIKGHWYAIYGDSLQTYGEAIYKDGRACFYSDDFGLRYRTFKIKLDTLEIYNDDMLDNSRKLSFPSSETMLQCPIWDNGQNTTGKPISFYKIIDSGVTDRLWAMDTAEQNRYTDGFSLRKAKWETGK